MWSERYADDIPLSFIVAPVAAHGSEPTSKHSNVDPARRAAPGRRRSPTTRRRSRTPAVHHPTGSLCGHRPTPGRPRSACAAICQSGVMATAEASTGDGVPPPDAVSSFAKSLFLGEIHGDMVFPYPCPGDDEERRIRDIVRALAGLCRGLRRTRDRGGALGLRRGHRTRSARSARSGSTCPRSSAGQGLSQTGYARVFEAIARIDPTLSVVLGVHQSIGYKGIALFGTYEQKERWLPDLATGAQAGRRSRSPSPTRAPTPGTSSRARSGRPTARGCSTARSATSATARAPTSLTTFARCEVDGKDRHIALLVEKGMEGFEVGERYDTMGLRANDLRQLSLPATCGSRPRTSWASPARASGSPWPSSTTAASAWAPARSAAARRCST